MCRAITVYFLYFKSDLWFKGTQDHFNFAETVFISETKFDYLVTGQGIKLNNLKFLKIKEWSQKALWGLIILSLLMALGVYRLDSLNAKPIEPSNFSWGNKVEIYALGVIMSLLATPIYPEVAREHMMLYTPFDEDPKIINNDFFMRSSLIQNAVRQAKSTGQPYRLAWSANAYQFSFDTAKYQEARIALALNGGHVRVEADKIIVRVKIGYPKNSFAPLLSIPGFGVIGIQEGLFWVLQQEKWYHTGYVEWVAKAAP